MKRQPMERNRGGTTAGVLVWTPAPAYSSPSSHDESDFSWDEKANDYFQRQMDENGIIGLAESDGQLELDHREEEIAEDLLWDVKTPEPEDGPPLSALEEISWHLSELLDSEPLSQPTEHDCHTPYILEEQVADDDQSVLSQDLTDDENDVNSPTIHRQEVNSFQGRDRTLDMTDEDPEEKDMGEDTQRPTGNSFLATEKIAPHITRIKGLDFSRTEDSKNIPHLEIIKHLEESDCEEPKKSKRHYPPTSHHYSPNTLYTFSHLPSEELMNNCGIEAETFSEQVLPNNRVESSLSHHQSSGSKTYQTVQEDELKHKVTSVQSPVMKITPGKTNQDGMSEDKLERRFHRPYHNHQLPTPSPRKTNPCSQEDHHQVSSHAQFIAKARERSPPPAPHRSSAKNNQKTYKTSYTDPDDIRKGQLSHPLPDFSKVEPRVRFPKGGYRPPKSRALACGKTTHSDLPVVFKSPAEIVQEVLLSSTESPGSPMSSETHRHLNKTVPEEFCCPQQATTLVQQLQEDYNRLLTKYAEAENTIDRLRLEAKVGLYSDLPKPSTAILSGVVQEGSKVMTLTFPQAQRAEFGAGSANLTQQRDISESPRKAPTRPSSVNSVSSRMSGYVTADHLTETLSNQTCRFQLQVDSFEDLLKNGKLKPCEELKGLSTLAEGQESLERAYLDARAQFQMLQQRQSRPLTFDPDRELEGQIFKLGMRLEEIREWVKQNQPTSEPPLSPPPNSDMLFLSMLETKPLPESPLSAARPEARVGVEVSSVSEESDEDRAEEEMLSSHLHPLFDKHQLVEKDFSDLIDCFQSFKELPGLLDRSVSLMGCDLLDFKDPSPPRNGSSKERQPHRATTEREKRQPAADCGPPSGPSVRSQVCDAMETHPKAVCHSSLLPGQPGRETKTAGNRKAHSSSLTSLSKSTNTGNMVLKAKAKTTVAPSLDGVVSPETDSGFMGSESSQLTPAVHSPLQKREVVRPSGPHMMKTVKPESAPAASPLVDSPCRSRLSLNPPEEHLSTGSVWRKGREERCSAISLATSTSPLHWPETTVQPWPSSITSQSEHGSDQVEEKAQDSPYPHPANQQPCFHRSPSLRVPYHHGNLKTQSPVQLTNHQKALQSLQQEVNNLKERLEGGLRQASKPASPVKVPPTLTEDTRDHVPPQTSTPHGLDLRSSERKGGMRSRENEEKVKGGTPRPALRKRSASAPQYISESNTTSDSEPRPSTLSFIPMSPMTSRGRRQSRAGFKHHKDCTTQQTSTPENGSDDSDKTELSRVQDRTCTRCMSERTSVPARQMRTRGSPRPTQSHCSHCPLCGALQASQSRSPQPENQDAVDTPRRNKPMRATLRDRVGVNVPVAPPTTVLGTVPVVPYVPVYPSTFYLSTPVTSQTHSQPFNISVSPSRDERSEVRGHRRRSLSMDYEQSSLSSSLTRAITVARNMRRVSRHMAHSLASGLENVKQPHVMIDMY